MTWRLHRELANTLRAVQPTQHRHFVPYTWPSETQAEIESQDALRRCLLESMTRIKTSGGIGGADEDHCKELGEVTTWTHQIGKRLVPSSFHQGTYVQGYISYMNFRLTTSGAGIIASFPIR